MLINDSQCLVIPMTTPAASCLKSGGVWRQSREELMLDDFLCAEINVPYKSVVLFSNSSYLRLLEYQQDTNAMLIMIAGHDHSVAGRIFLGSNTDY